jgi:hypothetical protein
MMLGMEDEDHIGRLSSRPVRIIGVPLWLRLLVAAIFAVLAVISGSWGYTALWAAVAALFVGVTVWFERPSR